MDEDAEPGARRLVESMALALQAALLVRHGDAAVADAFCAARLDRDGGLAYGTLPPRIDAESIVARNRPRL
jgi:putative acyl-CoA dehydrogenase